MYPRKAVGVLAVICLATGVLSQEALLSDVELGTNQNNFDNYWYFYDDNNDGGNTRITNAEKLPPPGDTAYATLVPAAGGNPSGTSGYCIRMAFQMGTVKPTGGGYEYPNFAGVGTMLCPEGATLSLAGATGFRFSAKASEPMVMRVELGTSVITDFCFHRTEVSLTTGWQEFTVLFGDLVQPTWGIDVALDLLGAQKFNFSISVEDNTSLDGAGGSISIDDIWILGYSYTPFDACPTCMGSPAGPPAGAVLADFNDRNGCNALGYYPYCYNDAEGRSVTTPIVDFSSITEGAEVDPTDPSRPPTLVVTENALGQDGSDAAFIAFTLGPSYPEGGNTVLPFVGIGMGLVDDYLLGTPFNAVDAGATGVYFDYKTSGDFEYVTLAVLQSPPVSTTNKGIVHYVKLPNTQGVWKGATVSWTDLVLPNWEEVLPTPLNLGSLAKLQWSVMAAPGTQGTMTIDNVVMIGATSLETPIADFRAVSSNGEFIARRVNNSIMYSVPSNVAGGVVQLVTPQGLVLVSQSITRGSASRRLPIRASSLAAGEYFLRLKTDRNTSVVLPLSIVK